MACDEGTVKRIPKLFPACAVTHAIAQAKSSPKFSLLYAAAELGGSFSEIHSSVGPPTFSSSLANLQVNEVSISNALSQQDLLGRYYLSASMMWMQGKLWLYYTKRCVNGEVEAIRDSSVC